jgi:hypothetical protein
MIALRPDTPLQMIAVDDLGAYGRLVFERAEQFNGRQLDIAGTRSPCPVAVARVWDPPHEPRGLGVLQPDHRVPRRSFQGPPCP